jgi:hypothetical protein
MRLSTLMTLTSALVVFTAAPTFAQTAPAHGGGAQADIDVGYNPANRVHNQDTTTIFKGGWHAGASYRVKRIISVLGEVSGDYHSSDGHTTSLYTYGGGVRFQGGDPKVRLRPFAQILLGGGQDNAPGGVHETNHYPMINPGGGVDLGISPKMAVRLRLDFPLLMTTGDPLSGEVSAGHTLKCTRFSIGLSFPLGAR